MENERNESFKKRDYSIRTIHKNLVCKILFLSSLRRVGMTKKEIHEELKRSMQTPVKPETVRNLLNDLQHENRVFKFKKKYLLDLFFDDGWSVFARFLEEFLYTTQHNLKEIPLQKIHSHRYIFSDNLENEIYNFGNVIGAFIMYVLVESFRPNERMIGREARDQIWKSFLERAVYMPYILDRFKGQLPEGMDIYQISLGSDNQSFDKIHNAYNNVYPGFSEFIDKSFKDHVRSAVPFEPCDHEWRKVKVHKIGDRHECRKCLGLAKEEDFEPVSN